MICLEIIIKLDSWLSSLVVKRIMCIFVQKNNIAIILCKKKVHIKKDNPLFSV